MIEITPADISRLNSEQMTDLLRRLLYLEAHEYDIPKNSIGISLKINVPDGGEDGHIEWEGYPESTGYFPTNRICFQVKAQPAFTEGDMLKEVIRNGFLKPMIEKTLETNGAYILFISCQLNGQQKNKLIAVIREQLCKLKKPYANECIIKVYDADNISAWTQKFLSAAIYVGHQLGKEFIPGSKVWHEWESTEKVAGTQFIDNSEIRKYVTEISGLLSTPKKCIRLIGLSGLGKTRIALEAFRAEGENLPKTINNFRIVYVNVRGRSEIVGAIISWIRNNMSGLLVLDNCPLDLHQAVKKEIERPESRLSLLTINNDAIESVQDTTYIKLTPYPNGHIESLLKQYYQGLSDNDVACIVHFARGFPIIAVNLGEARLRGSAEIGRLEDDTLLAGLLWGTKPPDPEAENIITICSIFERIGFEAPFDIEYQEISKLFGINQDVFYRHIKIFIEKGIIEQYGHYISIRPVPLAIELACKWWKRENPSRIKFLLENLSGSLACMVCERMRKLDFLENAKKFVADICGNQGPFGQAEVLNTEHGSQLFRSFVEVNPSASALAIYHAFLGWSTKALKEAVGPGRRNLIWSLEKLAFRKETFITSASLLLRLAAAENESWTNNATGIFLNLFHVKLSGTEASPDLRLQIINDAFNSQDIDIQKLGLSALSHVLQNSHFSRTLGAEYQGSSTTLQEWRPEYWYEVFDYWNAAIDKLIVLLDSDNDYISKKVIEIVEDRLLDLAISQEMIIHLDKIISKILIIKNNFWPRGYKVINNIVARWNTNLSEKSLLIIEKWLELLKPEAQSHENQMEMIINWPLLDNSEEQRNAVNALAKQVAAEYNLWEERIELFFKGNQYHGFLFGEYLCDFLNESEANRFIQKGMEFLRNNNGNIKCIIFGGFLKKYNRNFPLKIEEILNSLLKDEKLQHYYLYISSMLGLNELRLKNISKLLKIGKISVDQIKELCYAVSIKEIKANEIINIVKILSEINNKGCWIALEILSSYSHENDFNWKKIKNYLRKLIFSGKISFQKINTRTDNMDIYYLEEAVIALLQENDPDLAIYVTRDLLLYLKLESQDDQILKNILKILIGKYLESCWPLFSQILLSNDVMLIESLQMLLGVGFGEKNEGGLLFGNVSESFIFDWVLIHGKKAAISIARMTPVLEGKDGINWHPIAKWLIDNFGEEIEVLSALSINLGTYSWQGSMIPYLRKLEKLYSDLQCHPFDTVKKWAFSNMEYIKGNCQQQELYDQDGWQL